MFEAGPFGKTFAPTTDAATDARQSNRLAGEQQAVKVLRFALPSAISPTAPVAPSLLEPRNEVGGGISPDKAVMASLLRAVLGPEADSIIPIGPSSLLAPSAASVPTVPGITVPRRRVGATDEGVRVSGAGGGVPRDERPSVPVNFPPTPSTKTVINFEKEPEPPAPPSSSSGPFGNEPAASGDTVPEWKRDLYARRNEG